MSIILNVGCGQSPLKDKGDTKYWNLDMLKVRPEWNDTVKYVRHNLTKVPYPFEPEMFDQIFMFHTIEHIPEDKHHRLMIEFKRLLKKDGKLVISYPEFSEIAKNWLEDKDGQRKFWKATIYGRGLTEWDRHKTLMHTPDFVEFMRAYGFKLKRQYPEPKEPFNSVCIFEKGEGSLTYEQVLHHTILNDM